MALAPTDDDQQKVEELIAAGTRLCSAEAAVMHAEREAERSRVLLKRMRAILESIGHTNSLEEAWHQICLDVLHGRKEDLAQLSNPLCKDLAKDTTSYPTDVASEQGNSLAATEDLPIRTSQPGTPHEVYSSETSNSPASPPGLLLRTTTPAISLGSALRHPGKRITPTTEESPAETKRARV